MKRTLTPEISLRHWYALHQLCLLLAAVAMSVAFTLSKPLLGSVSGVLISLSGMGALMGGRFMFRGMFGGGSSDASRETEFAQTAGTVMVVVGVALAGLAILYTP